MDKDSAKKLIRETFENPFEKDRFIHFVKNLLNHVEDTPATKYQGNNVADAYPEHIQKLERVCKYTDPGEKQIDVLIVHLKKDSSLERARTTQRNFIAKYLDGRQDGKLKDAALVAFVAPNQEDWRFSLVKMDYRLDDSGEKIEKDITPARRFSYLVGQNENSHTAQSRLVRHLEDDDHNPTLTDLEDAFSIEKVTKEFFEEYRELFLKVKEALDGQVAKKPKIKKDFEANGVDTVNFAKKLLGQIVFLYFLQKKGWFGVARDDDWDTGPKDFLRKLFNKKICPYGNFFNDVLEYLFYDALREERPEDFYGKLNCKIPFLNGGLFDPINGYEWENTDILLPNELFSNSVKTKKEDIGTGILDVFDRYNFTVREDEPLEKEVAIDPEMLGKVFENLLEVKDRKSKGTYYTPREIVHYMCQESLVHYLDTEVNIGPTPMVPGKPNQPKLFGKSDPEQTGLEVPGRREIVKKEDLETFIRFAEMVVEHDSRVVRHGKETGDYSFKLPESIRKNAQALDDALAHIRICDPAVGSGAFLVGMMNEIVRARNALTSYLKDKAERTPYDFKRHTIHDCLYGVDIDPGAVEICKLRLWLSLVVDEEDFQQIQPLPNLDYKIVQGNSLLGIGKDLFNDELFKELESLKPKFFDETGIKKKQKYKNKIDSLIDQITSGRRDFDFEVYFSEIYHEKKGFDVILANPPYIRVQSLTKEEKLYYNKHFKTATKNYDIYVLFDEKGLDLLNSKGILSFIQPNKFFNSDYGMGLRGLITSEYCLQKIVNFQANQIFSAATTYTCLLFCSKCPNDNFDYIEFEKSRLTEASEDFFSGRKVSSGIIFERFKKKDFSKSPWTFGTSSNIDFFEKIECQGQPLSIYANKIFQGIVTSADPVYILEKKSKGFYSKFLNEFVKLETKFLKPLLKGSEIKRNRIDKNKYWLIFPYLGLNNNKKTLVPKEVLKKNCPLTWAYLKRCEKKLRNREKGKMDHDKWYAFVYPKNLNEFEQPKIITQVLAKRASMAIDNANNFYFVGGGNAGGYGITLKDNSGLHLQYILALLNSSLLDFYLQNHSSRFQNGYFSYAKRYIGKVPIKKISLEDQKPFVKLVTKIMTLNNLQKTVDNSKEQEKIKAYEKEIDQLVYELYDLTPDEIQIIESHFKQD